MNTRTFIAMTAALAASAAAISCGGESVMALTTASVEKRDICKTVTATGALEPVNKVDVGTQVSGIIDRIYVDFNSVVTRGQLLAEMDRTTLIAEVNSAKASLSSAEVELSYQTSNYQRYERLHLKGLVSDTDYEQALYQYEKAKLALESQKSAMSRVNRNLEYATITSPIDGVVLDRAVEEGQTVASGFNTPTLFTIAANLEDMQVIADVDEADIGYITEGQRVSFRVDAFPDLTFEGSVIQVRLNPQTESNVTTYEVVVNAPNPDQTLKPGMTANITIYTREAADALSVPMKALRFTPDQLPSGYRVVEESGKGTVWVEHDGNLTPTVVETGVNDGVYCQIKGEGLREGDRVATGYDQTGAVARGIRAKMEEMKPEGGPGGPEGPGAPGAAPGAPM